jgi:excisionase family DNA binding protein
MDGKPPVTPVFLGPGEVCAQFGVTRETVRWAMKKRQLRYYKLRRQISFRLKDVSAWASTRNGDD